MKRKRQGGENEDKEDKNNIKKRKIDNLIPRVSSKSEELITKARILRKNGKYNQAVDKLNELTDIEPNNHEAIYLRACIYFTDLNTRVKSIRDYKNVILIDLPDSIDLGYCQRNIHSFFRLGRMFHVKDLCLEAICYFSMGIEFTRIIPKKFAKDELLIKRKNGLFFFRALCNFGLRNYDSCLEDFGVIENYVDSQIQLKGESPFDLIFFYMGKVYNENKNYSLALEYFNKFIKVCKNVIFLSGGFDFDEKGVFFHRGVLYGRVFNKPIDAIKDFTKCKDIAKLCDDDIVDIQTVKNRRQEIVEVLKNKIFKRNIEKF